MDQVEFLKLYDEFCAEAKELLIKKNHDYTGSGQQGFEIFGNLMACEELNICKAEVGIAVRLTDKFKRLVTFIGEGKLMVEDEKVEDTLKDLHNYSFLLLALIKFRRELLAKDPNSTRAT